MRLHFRELGHGRPLILLHGLLGSLDNWSGIARRLAEERQVFALDQRNHGESPHHPEMDYPRMAGDVRSFMDTHGLPEVDLLGHSMGGKTAMTLALLHPDRVRRLVLVDIAPRGYARRHDFILDALAALDLSSLRARSEVEQALAPAIPSVALRRFLVKGVGHNRDGSLRWKFNIESLRENYDCLGAAVTGPGRFEKPVLFIRGARSDYINENDEAEIRRLFPSAQMVTIPEAGHWLHAEQPEIFLRHVREFLEKDF